MADDLPKIIKALRKQDFEIRTTRRGHHLVMKAGKPVTMFPGTPSDWRSLHNSLADCKRAGFAWPPSAPTRRRVRETVSMPARSAGAA